MEGILNSCYFWTFFKNIFGVIVSIYILPFFLPMGKRGRGTPLHIAHVICGQIRTKNRDYKPFSWLDNKYFRAPPPHRYAKMAGVLKLFQVLSSRTFSGRRVGISLLPDTFWVEILGSNPGEHSFLAGAPPDWYWKLTTVDFADSSCFSIPPAQYQQIWFFCLMSQSSCEKEVSPFIFRKIIDNSQVIVFLRCIIIEYKLYITNVLCLIPTFNLNQYLWFSKRHFIIKF